MRRPPSRPTGGCRNGRPTSPRPQARPAVLQPSLLDDPADQHATKEAGSIGSPSCSSAVPAHNAAAAGPKKSRPSKVAPRSGGTVSRAQLDGVRRPVPRPPALPPPTSNPLSGPTKYIGPPAARATARAMPRRAVPTPGSTTPSTTPLPRWGTARTQRVAPGAHVERRDVVRQVDDRRPRRPRRDDRMDDPDELVLGPEVGEEEDGSDGLTGHDLRLPSFNAADGVIVRWRPPPPP